MSEMVRLRIDTEAEAAYLDIAQIGNPKPDEGFAVPTQLYSDLGDAYAALNRAEAAIMRYVAEHYPEALRVKAWVADCKD